jgi:uncharacterized Zn-binding protein involved in type VI secretion
MGAPAIVAGDKVTGACPNHLIPGPLGAPIPSPAPLPFSAPLSQGLSTNVLIGGKAAAVMGSSGLNSPAHAGLHASDPFLLPATEMGRVTSGSATVLIGGQPAATAASQATCCTVPGKLPPSVSNVLIG